MVDRAAHFIATRIGNTLDMDKGKIDVLEYGAFGILQTVLSLIAFVIFGLVFNVLPEILVISFAASVLRKYTGGVHASSPLRCIVMGVMIFGIFSLIAKYVAGNMTILPMCFVVLVCFLAAFAAVKIYAPVDSVKKPIKDPSKRARLRKQAFVLLFILLLVTLGLLAVTYFDNDLNLGNFIFSICIAIIWQVFTLLPKGQAVFLYLDKVLNEMRERGVKT